jgi:quercetin dioxygenase-like cupin family protein
MRATWLLCTPLLFLPSCAPPPQPAAECHEHARPEPATPRPAGTEPRVISHAGLRSYENSGNALTGIATPSLGATSAEVWRSSIAPGSRTPEHTHASEEIFVVLAGRGVLHVGQQTLAFEAPATVIAPAGVAHWVENTGEIPTDQIVIVGAASEIVDAEQKVMALPWRR